MVDDDPLLLEVVSEELADRGYRIDTLQQAEKTLSYLQGHPVDLLLLDLKMPDLDGITLLQQIEQQFPQLPVIILTGHGDVGSASEVMRYGAAGYLQKPILIELLVEEIDQTIQKRGRADNRNNSTAQESDALIHQLKQILCRECPSAGSAGGRLPLMGVDEYHRQVILQYQHEMTETELARRLCFSRDKLWRIRKKLGIRRK